MLSLTLFGRLRTKVFIYLTFRGNHLVVSNVLAPLICDIDPPIFANTDLFLDRNLVANYDSLDGDIPRH